jgi:hypothetical protein
MWALRNPPNRQGSNMTTGTRPQAQRPPMVPKLDPRIASSLPEFCSSAMEGPPYSKVRVSLVDVIAGYESRVTRTTSSRVKVSSLPALPATTNRGWSNTTGGVR